jgi:hypothetical protein
MREGEPGGEKRQRDNLQACFGAAGCRKKYWKEHRYGDAARRRKTSGIVFPIVLEDHLTLDISCKSKICGM